MDSGRTQIIEAGDKRRSSCVDVCLLKQMTSPPCSNMRPVDVQFVLGISGYLQKDLEAVRRSSSYRPLEDSILPKTPGFTRVVQPGQIISILIHLADGSIAVGECVDVIFSGAAARDPVFLAEEHLLVLKAHVRPWLLGCDLSIFRVNAYQADGPWLSVQGKRLHTAVRYGLTQALLSATALFHRVTIAEIITKEWKTSISERPVDILASCHRDDHMQLDRMIMKQVALLPHASFVHIDDIGPEGSSVLEYVQYVAHRVQQRGAPGYRPRLHFDVYGTLGDVFTDNTELAVFLARMCQAAQPYELLVESPIIAATKAAQIQRLADLRLQLRQQNINVKLVVDEWCNTVDDIRDFVQASAVDYIQIKMPDLGGINNAIDAVLYCRQNGMGCCLGGSANETDISARISAQIALATEPNFMLSKPGIGGDEGLMILTNEMLRTAAIVGRRNI